MGTDSPNGADLNNYVIDTDRGRLDLDLVHDWLSTDAFWAIGRSREVVETAADNSINFGVYLGVEQVGFVPYPTPERLMLLSPPAAD